MTFTKTFSKIQTAINKSTNRALKRALTSTRAVYAREVSADLGLTVSKAKTRIKLFNPTKDNPVATMSVGVKVEFSASEFKPKKTKVQSKRGPRTGASYTVKGRPTVTVQGGFVIKGKASGKNIIVQRVGDPKLPTKLVRAGGFKESVERLQPILQKHMMDTFEKNFYSELKFNMSEAG